MFSSGSYAYEKISLKKMKKCSHYNFTYYNSPGNEMFLFIMIIIIYYIFLFSAIIVVYVSFIQYDPRLGFRIKSEACLPFLKLHSVHVYVLSFLSNVYEQKTIVMFY